MPSACDDCGADGEELQCICTAKENNARNKAKPREVRPVPAALRQPRPDVLLFRVSDSKGDSGDRQAKAPQESDYRGEKVKCCRCGHVHWHGDRLNEWGQKAGKVMAGRRTECPAGCGYHVTVPYEE